MPKDQSCDKSEDRRARRVLLIGWDAADWQMIQPLMDAGRMPNMARFVREGAHGNIATLTPALSPILWTSIATGKHADKHGILGFAEPDGSTGQPRPVTSTSRRCRAIWNILSDAGLRSGVVNWYASHPAERINGFVVTDRFAHATNPPDPDRPDLGWPTVARSVHPEALLGPLARVRVHPAMTTREQVEVFIPGAAGLDAQTHPKIGELRTLLAHCATVHNAATALMQDEPWDFLGIYYDAIDRLAHAFMEFHPPRMEHVSAEDFELYQGVMTACYEYHDLMLGRLMRLAGDDTTVVILSDHGFYSDHRRPTGTSAIRDGQPVAWHRAYGVIAAWGPGIKHDETIYGASLLDVTPTILTMLGLPVGEDMDGSPLVQIFEDRVDVPLIASHETDATHDAEPEVEDPWVAQQMLEQLKALGYVDASDTESLVNDRLRNLASVYASTGRPERALETYDELLVRNHDEASLTLARAAQLLALGRLDECERAVGGVIQRESDTPRAHTFLAMIAQRRGELALARVHLDRVIQADPDRPEAHAMVGQLELQRNRLGQAESAFERALAIDSEHAEALDGLGVVYRRQGKPAEAVLAHMRSIALVHYRPQSHVHLGLALGEAGRVGWATEAFSVALRMNPNLVLAHQCLAQLYERAHKNPQKMRYHRERARALAGLAGEHTDATE